MAQEIHVPSRALVFVDGKWLRSRDLETYRQSLGHHCLKLYMNLCSCNMHPVRLRSGSTRLYGRKRGGTIAQNQRSRSRRPASWHALGDVPVVNCTHIWFPLSYCFCYPRVMMTIVGNHRHRGNKSERSLAWRCKVQCALWDDILHATLITCLTESKDQQGWRHGWYGRSSSSSSHTVPWLHALASDWVDPPWVVGSCLVVWRVWCCSVVWTCILGWIPGLGRHKQLGRPWLADMAGDGWRSYACTQNEARVCSSMFVCKM